MIREQPSAVRPRSWLAGFILLLLATTGPALAQQQKDAANPSGRWESLEGCRLATNRFGDGDSFHVRWKARDYVFRLYFVDAPETSDEFPERVKEQAAAFGIAPAQVPVAGALARDFALRKLGDARFTVKTRWQNGRGQGPQVRYVGFVTVDGRDLGELLVEAGLARVHGWRAAQPGGASEAEMLERLQKMEARARKKQLGIWDPKRFPRVAAPAAPRVDLNTATAAELRALPGIGTKLAERIVARRPFRSVEELGKIPGIRRQTLDRLRPLVRVAEKSEHK